jgi:hypothetical protein
VIQNYSFYADSYGRGVGLFVKNNLNLVRRDDLELFFRPSVFCDITIDNDIIHIGVVYRSPNCTANDNNKLNNLMNEFFVENHHKELKIIVGDFNYPEINWTEETCKGGLEHPASMFLKSVLDNFLSQLVDKPTHFRALQNPTTIDLILCQDPIKIENIQYHPPIVKSHHSTISFDLNMYGIPVEKSSKRK